MQEINNENNIMNKKQLPQDAQVVQSTLDLINIMFGDPVFKEYKQQLLAMRKEIHKTKLVNLRQMFEVNKIHYNGRLFVRGNN